jgi:carbon-monoxide dehydrogenase medium subunit
MKPPPFEYAAPESLEAALAVKAEHGDNAVVLAGGQSLMPRLNRRDLRPAVVLDLGRIPGLATLTTGDDVAVGPMVRMRDVELSGEVATACPVLPEALGLVAHPTIRNRGTVVGSLAEADRAAELPAALLALDGCVQVASSAAQRSIPAAELFAAHLRTSLRADELITGASFPVPAPGAGTAVRELARRHGDCALAGVVAILDPGPDGRQARARIATYGVAPTPRRAHEAERILEGAEPTPAAFAAAAEAACATVEAVDEEQASVRYRHDLLRTLVARALDAAWAGARREVAA